MGCFFLQILRKRQKSRWPYRHKSYVVHSGSVITRLVLLHSGKLIEEQEMQSEDNLGGMIKIADWVLENQLGMSVFNHVQVWKVRAWSDIGNI